MHHALFFVVISSFPPSAIEFAWLLIHTSDGGHQELF